MGENRSAVLVRGGGLDATQVVNHLIDHWHARGAIVLGREPDANLEPYTRERTLKLGYAVHVLGDWVEVLDSEQYTAHFPLLESLAAVPHTEVAFVGVADVAQEQFERRIRCRTAQLPNSGRQYRELCDERPDGACFVVLGEAIGYDVGPLWSHRLMGFCAACDELEQIELVEVAGIGPAAPLRLERDWLDSRGLVVARYPEGDEPTRVLLDRACRCGAANWYEIEVRHGTDLYLGRLSEPGPITRADVASEAHVVSRVG